MRALCWYGTEDVRVETCPDPEILNPRDAIVKVTSTAICGSDLHLYNGYIPTMRPGDIIGHEFMGEVVETGPKVQNLSIGDRVVVPFAHRLRRLLVLRKGSLVALRQQQPQSEDLAETLRKARGRPLRLFPHDGRIRRGAGGVRSGSLR